MIGQTSQRIAQCLAAQMILKGPLFCDINSNNFITDKYSTLVKYAAPAEPGFQSSAVFSLPLYFDRLNSHRFGGASGQRFSLTEIEHDLRRTIRCQYFLFGFIAEHCQESLVDVEKFSFRVAPAYPVGGILHQRAIQRLRMSQGFSC